VGQAILVACLCSMLQPGCITARLQPCGHFTQPALKRLRPYSDNAVSASGKYTLIVSMGAVLGLIGASIVTWLISVNPVAIRGAVLRRDPDPARQLPVASASITISGATPLQAVRSDPLGYFNVRLKRRIRRGQPITIHLRHPDYEPLDLQDSASNNLFIAFLTPIAHPTRARIDGPEVKIANVVAQYSVATTNAVNVGSAFKTFVVENKGNVPCPGRGPCSPDRKWKASIGSAVIDAGPGNEFQNARASCIAGPCPFTRIDDTSLSHNRQSLTVSVLNWSDTATFLVEAEVYKPVVADILRRSYPVIFDEALTFTLPAAAQGVSIQADIDGSMIVFPLGPALYLSWADCQLSLTNDQTKVYRCALKPGFHFSPGRS